MKSPFLIGLIAVVGTATMPAFAADIVTNGGFETGDLSGWTQTGWDTNLGDVTGPNSGAYYAGNSCTVLGCLLSQTLATNADADYALNFWYDSGPGTGDELELRVSWDGVQIDDIVGNTNGYVNFSYAVTASTASTILQFEGLTLPSYDGIDDISVTTAAPEPGTITLLLGGLAAVVVRRRRRARS